MKAIRFLGLVAASIVAPAALAASTWTVSQFLDGSTASTALASNVTAHSTTGTGGTLQGAMLCNYSGDYGIVNRLEGTTCSTSAPEHSADNSGYTDMFLLTFNSAVKLTTITIGWNGTDNWGADSDISLLAYNGASAPTVNGKNLSNTASGLLGNNWQVVGNYSNVGAVEPDVVSTGATTYSSWWLISAWNSSFGGGFTGSTGTYIDYFKLISVTVDTPPPPPAVPEPGSLALLGVGLLGLLHNRRRKAA